MRRKLVTAAILVAALVAVTASPASAYDRPAEPDTQYILDNLWLIIAAVLVYLMQAGFGLVEAGLTRAKNVANIMMKNLMDMAAGVLAFALVGFSIAYGPTEVLGGLFGFGGWALDPAAYDESGLTIATQFFFQAAFAATAATIVSGAMAERTKFKSYFVYSFVITALIYPTVVRWTWGGGWLSQLSTPFSDFAGSTIVHGVGGWAALMGALIVGPRIGKFTEDGRPRAIPGHSIAFVVLGAFVLFVGWFGFNPGSELAADLAVMDIAVTTLLAACAGACTATVTIWTKSGKPDVGMAANGLLAGLVAITAGCGAFDNWGAVITGAVAGVIVVMSVLGIERFLKIDDPVGAISVHGVCGAWGTLAIGLFSVKDDAFLGRENAGLFYGGGFDQLVTQAVFVVSVFAFVTITAGLMFLVIKKTIGLRVSEQEEIEGLDVFEHGSPGYGPDVIPSLSTAGSRATTPDRTTVPV